MALLSFSRMNQLERLEKKLIKISEILIASFKSFNASPIELEYFKYCFLDFYSHYGLSILSTESLKMLETHIKLMTHIQGFDEWSYDLRQTLGVCTYEDLGALDERFCELLSQNLLVTAPDDAQTYGVWFINQNLLTKFQRGDLESSDDPCLSSKTLKHLFMLYEQLKENPLIHLLLKSKQVIHKLNCLDQPDQIVLIEPWTEDLEFKRLLGLCLLFVQEFEPPLTEDQLKKLVNRYRDRKEMRLFELDHIKDIKPLLTYGIQKKAFILVQGRKPSFVLQPELHALLFPFKGVMHIEETMDCEI